MAVAQEFRAQMQKYFYIHLHIKLKICFCCKDLMILKISVRLKHGRISRIFSIVAALSFEITAIRQSNRYKSGNRSEMWWRKLINEILQKNSNLIR
jgi:hypothetical protein